MEDFTIDQLVAAFNQKDNKQTRTSNYYRFYDMKVGEQAVVRFLPDLDESNPLKFMVEKLVHNIEINGKHNTVPCLRMYGDDCPICKLSSLYYKEEGKDSVNGKKYWRSKQHLLQVLVMEDPLPPNPETGETNVGKVCFLNIGYQLYSAILEGMSNGELKRPPYFLKGGYDFIIKKTEAKGRAKYDLGSRFVRDSSDLTADELEIVEENMIPLSSLLPAHPGYETVDSMLSASLNGTAYVDSTVSENVESVKQSTPVTSTVEQTVVTDSSAYDEDKDDILAMIRNRKKAKAE